MQPAVNISEELQFFYPNKYGYEFHFEAFPEEQYQLVNDEFSNCWDVIYAGTRVARAHSQQEVLRRAYERLFEQRQKETKSGKI